MRYTRQRLLESRIINAIPYQVLVEQSLVGIYLIQDGILKYCNNPFAEITGHRPEQLIGNPIADVVAPHSIDRVLNHIQQRISQGSGSSIRYFNQAVHVDGHLVDLEVHGRSIMHEGRPAIAGVAVDVTQRLQYERELKDSHHQLQQMTRLAIKLREQQREDMARDIHDELGGLLTSIKLDASRILNHPTSPEVEEIVNDILSLAQDSINFARSKSEQLYPATLKYLGLGCTLENLLKHFQQRSELACQLSIQSQLPRLVAEAELMIYRIVQESLTNVARHAKATAVNVTIRLQEQSLRVCINDNGRGIEPENFNKGSLGLLFMRERAADFDGQVHVSRYNNRTDGFSSDTLASDDWPTSEQTSGTRVCLELPLTEQLLQANQPPADKSA
ncbi:PAS domain-containing sensor histidine kinase [Oceanobacter mangrovi]|uniref:PAS domain-containing sensor histidine kinase n=1 Tax=Oceanobacter mangrovi TaxID=2862510 RepID=UPI001C8EB362|nr:PAS domain-containing sensor histidine kinase [Oceanobacter mangrovi]